MNATPSVPSRLLVQVVLRTSTSYWPSRSAVNRASASIGTSSKCSPSWGSGVPNTAPAKALQKSMSKPSITPSAVSNPNPGTVLLTPHLSVPRSWTTWSRLSCCSAWASSCPSPSAAGSGSSVQAAASKASTATSSVDLRSIRIAPPSVGGPLPPGGPALSSRSEHSPWAARGTNAAMPGVPPARKSRGSVPEVPGAGQDHGHAVLIGRLEDLLIPDRPTWVDHGPDAGRGGPVDAVPEREEGVRGHHRARSPGPGLAAGDVDRVHPAHLACPDPNGGPPRSQDDGVRPDASRHAPGQEQVVPLARFGLAAAGHRERLDRLVHGIELLNQGAPFDGANLRTCRSGARSSEEPEVRPGLERLPRLRREPGGHHDLGEHLRHGRGRRPVDLRVEGNHATEGRDRVGGQGAPIRRLEGVGHRGAARVGVLDDGRGQDLLVPGRAHHPRPRRVVLGRGPHQRGAADVDLLDDLVIGAADGGPLERIEVRHDQVERLDAVLAQLVEVLRL